MQHNCCTLNLLRWTVMQFTFWNLYKGYEQTFNTHKMSIYSMSRQEYMQVARHENIPRQKMPKNAISMSFKYGSNVAHFFLQKKHSKIAAIHGKNLGFSMHQCKVSSTDHKAKVLEPLKHFSFSLYLSFTFKIIQPIQKGGCLFL